jgi:hypothetical protein
VATRGNERLDVDWIVAAGGLGAKAKLHVGGSDPPAPPRTEGGGFNAEEWRSLFIGEETVAGGGAHEG